MGDGEEPMALRQKIATALGEVKREEARKILLETLPNAAMGLQTAIGVALASTTEGAESLLAATEAGKTSARLLQERSVKDRIVAAKPANAPIQFRSMAEYRQSRQCATWKRSTSSDAVGRWQRELSTWGCERTRRSSSRQRSVHSQLRGLPQL